jgi:hypothetical protein
MESRKLSNKMEMERTDYHDFSNVASEDEDAIQSLLQIGMNNGNVAEESKSFTNGDAQNFPVQLHFALSEMEADGLGYLASWAPHGRCFFVHKKEEFVDMILCRYVCTIILCVAFPPRSTMYNDQRQTETTLFVPQLVSSDKVHLVPATVEYLRLQSHHAR